MRDADVIGVALFLMSFGGKRGAVPWGSGWWWPVPAVRLADKRELRPQVTQEFKAEHEGVDIMFRDASGYFAPEGTPITAARAGKVWSVSKGPRGWAVVVDHGKPFATFYQHLQSVSATLKKGVVVGAGQRLGAMGIDPLDAAQVRHLHFAVLYEGKSVDPAAVIGNWLRPAIAVL